MLLLTPPLPLRKGRMKINFRPCAKKGEQYLVGRDLGSRSTKFNIK